MAYRANSMVATVVEPPERSRLEAGANGGFAVIHSDTLREALRTVRERPVNAVLVSPRCVSPDQLSNLTTLVRGFPGVPTVAVLSRHDAASSERLLHLGACGVARVLDLGVRDGWQRLRDLVAQPAAPTASLILARVVPALGDASLSCRRYFEVLVQRAPGVTTVRALARQLGMGTSTFMSRFFRARCTPRGSSNHRACRSPTWPTAWSTRHRRASVDTCGRRWGSPPGSFANGMLSTPPSTTSSHV